AAAPGTTGAVGKTAQPAIRGDGIGGDFRQDPGFKRSDDDADMDSASLYDVPGTKNKAGNRSSNSRAWSAGWTPRSPTASSSGASTSSTALSRTTS
ncbi:MAG TPA: hypothetical protein VIJ23_04010, partial [Mycobacterium sp.]